MNKERLLRTLELYENKLTSIGISPVHRAKDGGFLGHTCWMVVEAKKLANEGKIEKANRWLGFIQGVLWIKGIWTIAEMKSHNKLPSSNGQDGALLRRS